MSTVLMHEVETFAKVAGTWWDEQGPFRILHHMNPLRIQVVRDETLAHYRCTSLQGLTFLDVGCGGGLVCEPLARLGGNVTGIDATPDGIEVAKKHAQDQGLSIDYQHTTVEMACLTGQQYDVVTCFEVIEHVQSPSLFLKHLIQLVKPGGLFFLSTLNRTTLSLLLGKYAAEYILGWAPPGTHTWDQFVTPSELSQWIHTHGGETYKSYGMTLDLIKDTWRLSPDHSINYVMIAKKAGETDGAAGTIHSSITGSHL